MKAAGGYVHILDTLGWLCVAMIVVVYVMGRKVDTVMHSANAAIMAMYVSLSLASFTAAHHMKSTEWSRYCGVVQATIVPTDYPDGREVTFETPGIPREVEAFSSTDTKAVYLCAELTCHHLEAGDQVFMQRKWSESRQSWLMQGVAVIKQQ